MKYSVFIFLLNLILVFGTPGTFGTPGKPDKPGKLGTHGAPRKFGAPGKPGTPEKPGTPGKPETSRKPGTPGKPITRRRPETKAPEDFLASFLGIISLGILDHTHVGASEDGSSSDFPRWSGRRRGNYGGGRRRVNYGSGSRSSTTAPPTSVLRYTAPPNFGNPGYIHPDEMGPVKPYKPIILNPNCKNRPIDPMYLETAGFGQGPPVEEYLQEYLKAKKPSDPSHDGPHSE